MKKNGCKENINKGMLIVFEGISGSGKSEGVNKLTEYLRNQGYGIYIAEWNSNKIIRKLVSTLRTKNLLTPVMYSILQIISFLTDYFLKTVPQLKKNHIVVADRYIYTALTRDRVNGAGNFFGRLVYHLIRKPDILFFYDTHPDICSQRIKIRGKALFHTNRYILKSKLIRDKNLYYLQRTRDEYLKLLGSPYINSATGIIYIKNNVESIIDDVESYIHNTNNKPFTAKIKASKTCEKYVAGGEFMTWRRKT